MKRNGDIRGAVRARDVATLARLAGQYALDLTRRGMLEMSSLRAHFARATLRELVRGVGERDHPEIATLVVTPRCPLDCWHCSEGVRRGRSLPREAMLGVIDDLQRMGTSAIAFTGGEPFLSERLAEYIERVAPPTGALVFSSGWELPEETARRLEGRSNLLVLVSVDSLDEAEHDRLRGREGSYSRAIATLETLRRYRIQREVSTLVTSGRIRSGELERFLLEMRRLGIEAVQIFQPRPVGKLRAAHGSLLTAEDRQWMIDLARRSATDRRLPLLLNYPYVESPEVLGCCGGTYRLYVDSRGEVCPCDFCPVSYGNVQDEPLERIWRRMRGELEYPRADCLVERNREILGELEGAGKLPHEELARRGGGPAKRPAGVFERYGDGTYRLLLKHMYFVSRMYPKIDPRFVNDEGR